VLPSLRVIKDQESVRIRPLIMNNHLILMNEFCLAFPQEWASLVPALEYLTETAPREPHGLSAFDLSQGYGLLVDPNRRLSPFQLPWGLPETDVAQQLFTKFKELYGVFARATAEEVVKRQEELNRTRTVRVLDMGEVVFRELPAFARPAKPVAKILSLWWISVLTKAPFSVIRGQVSWWIRVVIFPWTSCSRDRAARS
jgi:hypothetical protein